MVLAGLLAPSKAPASYFFVDTVHDAVDVAPGDGICADSGANCTLRAAIMETNALPGKDTINLGVGTYTLTIPGNAEHAAAEGDLDVLDSVTIQGVDPQSTIIDGGGIDRVFEVINAPNVVISRLTIQNGVAGFNTPGYYINFAGGGIFHVGSPSTLTLLEIDVRNNSARNGGGIYNIYSSLQLYASAVYDNTATDGGGGGVAESLASFIQIQNTTISGNTATLNGGGLVTSNNAATLNNVTISNNTADSDNDGNGNGGGIARGITAPNVSNSIIAGNNDPGGEAPDCSGGITSHGYNIIGDDSDCAVTPDTGDQIGTASGPVDPRLAPLANNGGSTRTHALLNGSPALDNGNPAAPGSGGNACEATDQRGTDRTLLAPCDTGAFENTPSAGVSFTVNSVSDVVDAAIGDGACETVPGNNTCTLRAAIQETNALIGSDQIILPAGHYVLGIAGINEEQAAAGDLDISDDLELLGADRVTTRIDANFIDRVFQTRGSTNFSISGVTVENGSASGGSASGGGFYHQSSKTLTVSDCIVTANNAGGGGGIFTVGFNYLVVRDSVISNNTVSGHGGGIANFTFSNATLSNNTISGNSASVGGGLMNSFLSYATLTGNVITDNQAQHGGGVGTLFGSGIVTLINTTVSGNRASVSGGGISVSTNDTVNLRNTTITDNLANSFADGGGIASSGTVNMRNSIIAGNNDVGGEAPDCSGVLTSQGYNLLGNDTACTYTSAAGDQIGNIISPINPLLGPLADNGGATFSHALLAGSPAFNAGNPATAGNGGNSCAAFDQRGVDRVVNAPCDIGAVETVTADLGITLTDSLNPALPGDTLDYLISVTNEGPDTATNVVIADTLPDGISFVSATGSGWNCAFATPVVSCALASLSSASASTLTVSVSMPITSGTYASQADVFADTLDLNTANNSATELTRVNAAPVVSTTASSTFITGKPAVAIASDATVADIDDTHLESARAQITGGYQPDQDELRITDSSAITGNWDAATGTLTLTGTETVENYQSALRSIQYINTNGAAVSGIRSFSYTTNDGDTDSVVTGNLLTVTGPQETNDQPDNASSPVETPPSDGGLISTLPTPGDPVTTSAEADSTSADTTESNDPGEAGNDEPQPEVRESAVSSAEPSSQRSASTQSSQPRNRLRRSSASWNTSSIQRDPGVAPRQVTQPATESLPSRLPGSEFSYLQTLYANKALWNQLDSMRQQMNDANREDNAHEKVVIGTAKGMSLVLFAGVMNWYLKAGSLLASLLSSAPLWAPFDPLPILSLSRQERNRRRNEDERHKQLENRDQADLGGLLDDTPYTSDPQHNRGADT